MRSPREKDRRRAASSGGRRALRRAIGLCAAALVAGLLAVAAFLEMPDEGQDQGSGPVALATGAPALAAWSPQPMPAGRPPLPGVSATAALPRLAPAGGGPPIESLEAALATSSAPHGGQEGVARVRPSPEQAAQPLATLPPDMPPLQGPADKRLSPPVAALAQGDLPAWRQFAVPVAPAEGRPRIAIVIDDLGPAQAASLRAAELPGPLTLALLPYADGLPALAAAAHAAGHELLVHMPMQPIDLAHNNPGPGALLIDLGEAELAARLEANLASFAGYVGINNHMGSAFSTYGPGLELVMARLKAGGLLFLDSRTIGNSQAERHALDAGVPALGRDVFLDNEPDDPAAIWAQLRLTEQIALKHGQAVAIGHPHAATLAALAAWLPELEARGFQLVPVSALAVEPTVAAGLFANSRDLLD